MSDIDELAPPQNREAERAVLGAMLLSADAVADVLEVLRGKDFYVPAHQVVFEAISGMFAAGAPVDAVTVAERLAAAGELKRIGGGEYLHTLIHTVPSAASAGYYAGIVADTAAARRLAEAGIRITQAARSGQENVADLAEQILFDATDTGRGGDVAPVSDLLAPALDRLEQIASGNGPVGLSTGLPDLDKVLGGLLPGQLIVVAGRPAMGKSVLAADIARHASLRVGAGSLLVSLEMSRDEVVTRLLSAESGVPLSKLTGKTAMTDSDWSAVAQAAGRIADGRLWIDSSPQATVMDVRAKARRLSRTSTGTLGLIVVDYLQLMPSVKRAETREREVAEISRGLKLLAKDIACPVIAVAQLNRGVETRTDKRPLLSDLRESGALEADADAVLLLYRDDYYDPESTRSGEIDIHVAKNRNGATDTITAVAQLHKARIVSMAT